MRHYQQHVASWFPQGSILAGIPTNAYDADVSVAHTISIMQQDARASASRPLVQDATACALWGLPQDASSEDRARAIWRWVKRFVRMVEDETILANELQGYYWDKELLITPERLLTMQTPVGDCDDHSTLLASMLLAAGIPASFVTIAADPSAPDKFSHVYVAAHLPKNRILHLDASHGTFPGWEATEFVTRKQYWPV